ncbi:1-acyl-sn-glycerol-3-phosphate acyltransferase [Rhodohalobacter sp. SW132]|uniref:lysophospholipid acyltransferase family protein n=1 Tax=Rhodohalobacter sp. SW132 TaxID=2293433 RepID=UPI000E25858D|nr:lysophospholipid acyltransferase family protein [Rhodohalobacter sp. SW132]REL38789.1 1-acyl-sn-glycerol-3-phosphate acyltransferase [Rhodohalobacter sp. SW132]
MAFTFKKNERNISGITFPFMRKTIIPVSRFLFSPVVTNPENMPQTGPCFIYGNHSNYFDPFFLNLDMTAEPTAGVMTRDQFHKTIPRIFMDSIGIVPTSKYVPEPGIVRDVIRMIDNRRMIVIFPEGGRRWDGKPKPVIETTLKLFWKMKIPVHPVQIHGSYLSWPRWADYLRKSTIEIRWMKPMLPSDFDDYETFAASCKEKIAFDEYSPPDTVRIHSAYKPASGISRFLYRCPESGVSGSIFSPDGRSVYSRTSNLSFTMDTESRLIDPQGISHSLPEIFAKIGRMPIGAARDSVILQDWGSNLFKIDKSHQLKHIGRGYTELKENHIFISTGSDRFTIPLEDVQYLSVEQNHKITVTSSRHIFQVEFNDTSALQWKNYILRLKEGEQTVRETF